MSFGDYQQNYRDLHQRILESRAMNKPVVNSEYGYYLRDSNFDGKVDKHNSATPEDMRFATWDIIMAGGYPITGYATTYMGGYRDKGPFNPDDPRNLVWTAQYRLAQHFLSSLDWWKLEPHDEWIQASEPRMQDRERRASNGSNGTRTLRRPPLATYWLLADPGRQYVAYGRGLSDAVSIRPEGRGAGPFQATYFNPRTGVVEDLGELTTSEGAIAWTPPDDGDWVLLLNQANR